jgi:hypothetical protein
MITKIVICPECGNKAFPTNFPPSSFGGRKNDKHLVFLCSQMGHYAFTIKGIFRKGVRMFPKDLQVQQWPK